MTQQAVAPHTTPKAQDINAAELPENQILEQLALHADRLLEVVTVRGKRDALISEADHRKISPTEIARAAGLERRMVYYNRARHTYDRSALSALSDEEILPQLSAYADIIKQAEQSKLHRNILIEEANKRGMSPTQVAQAANVQRRTVYNQRGE